MMKKLLKRVLPLGLCAALCLSALWGCGTKDGAGDLTEGTAGGKDGGTGEGQIQDGKGGAQGNPASAAFGETPLPDADAASYTDFAVRLLQECANLEEEGNMLISPLSVVNALAMTAYGARGETLSQMEKLFGANLGSLGEYLQAYNNGLPTGEKYKLHSANSIWIRDDERFTVSPDFLETNKNLFGAGIYEAPFDASTLKSINGWVSEHTDNMIPEILNEIPTDAVMYLINALAFDVEWQDGYNEFQVREGVFTGEDGAAREAEMMYSSEYAYLQEEQAQGFIKYYSDKKYAFAALLPEEGVSLRDYVASLTGERLRRLLSDPVEIDVETAIPKFEAEYDILLNPVLEEMGMQSAFDPGAADLSGIGTSLAGNLYISRVLHKTYIAVDEKGTKAGAATAVEIYDECCIEPVEKRIVYLDRPFVYMIIDCQENLPVFIGTVTEL